MEDPDEVHNLILQACKKYENQVAIIYDDNIKQLHITYNELKSMVNCLTEALKQFQIFNNIVGYYGNTNAVFTSLFVSILKESSSFATLHLNSPNQNKYLIQSVGIKWIFVDERFGKVGDKQLGYQVENKHTINVPYGKLFLMKVVSPPICPNIKNYKLKIAYVIQTSGTTGKPKIVHVPHSCIVPNIINLSEIFSLRKSDIVLLNSPLTFDPSIVEMFSSLISGSTLLIIPEAVKVNSLQLLHFITSRHKVTVLMATPSTIKRMGTEQIKEKLVHFSSSLRILCFGGEVCFSVTTLRKWIGNENKISLFNIYGITEVSSWAMIHQITNSDLKDVRNEIPLGKALNLTEIEVRDENGQRIEHGVGILYIGGHNRICYIDDENDTILQLKPVFRETGDVVKVDAHGEMYFLYRRDKQVKRYGKKVSLSSIEDVVSIFDCIESSCAVFDVESHHICLFVILKSGTEMTDLFREELDQHLHLKLEAHAIPNCIIPISSLPLTTHGKINSEKLLQMARNRFCKPLSFRKYLEEEWKRLLNVSIMKTDDNFISHGGDSIQVIQLSEDLCLLTEHPLPQLIDLLLNSTFDNICTYIDKNVIIKTNSNPSEICELEKDDSVTFKNKNILETANRNLKLIYSQRCKEVTLILPQDIILNQIWKYNLNKCIDASPLIVGLKGNSSGTVYIGSHSNEFAAIDQETGNKIWLTKLGGRIESSACVSSCGKFIVVGCYDGFIYCLRAENGEINWRFQTKSQVKCSPVVDSISGNILIGAHDHFVYCVDVVTSNCVWKLSPSNGSIFASPCVVKQPYCIYIATLDGILCSIDPTNGSLNWKRNLEKPIFSTPVVSNEKVLAATVKGELCCFSHSGKELWLFSTNGPIFSSPNVIHNKFVLFGCHDNKLYCVFIETGNICWELQMDSPIYASPFSIHYSSGKSNTTEDENNYICVVATVKGCITLVSVENGNKITSHNLSGEIFSSPVVFNNKLVIGCRDNYVYCFDFIT